MAHNHTHNKLRLVLLLLIAAAVICGGVASSRKFAGWAAKTANLARAVAEPAATAAAAQTEPQPLSPTVQQEIAALTAEKQSRTTAQKKINSQLLYAIKMDRGEPIATGIQTLITGVVADSKGLFDVDIRAALGGTLIEKIDSVGGQVISVSARSSNVRAKLPPQRIEEIAALSEVKSIRPKLDPITMRDENPTAQFDAPKSGQTLNVDPSFEVRAERVRAALTAALQGQSNVKLSPASPTVGSKNSEGDATHRAVNARNNFGVSGAGVKIGVLSDGVLALAQAQALGDLGPVTVLPGQAGVPGDEGTAMLEIIHDLAPNAQLFFATAFNGADSFADNIRALRAAGCDIIIDDVFYFDESPFQEGQAANIVGNSNGAVIAQAVLDVTNDGALYFSSAGNAGSKVNNTSGVWEGDFVDGGPAAAPIGAANGNVHNFGGSLFNTLTASQNRVFLFWSDPLAASSNDYDLYILNAAGSAVLGASTGAQDGSQDPVEGLSGTIPTNVRIVVVKFSGADRFLHLNTIRGRLAISTNGQTHGHSSIPAAFSCAATPANAPFGAPPNPVGPFPNPFNSTNKNELFSSDGPRRVFFNNVGAPITPGNVSSTGGALRAKPDITAADGTAVTGVGGFPTTFYGTSAAAPHAGAIAALIKSANPSLTPTQIRTILTTTAIDIEAPGYDSLSGFGIIDALSAVTAVNPTPQALLTLGTVTAAEGSVNNGDGQVEPGETGNIVAQINNPSIVNATNVQATLSLLNPTPGVTIISGGPAGYGNINAGANATNAGSPFVVGFSRNIPCGTTISFALTVTFGGGASPVIFNFPVTIGLRQAAISSTLDTTAPAAGTGYTAITGLQTARLVRNGLASTCAGNKANPGTQPGGGSRRFDAYTFTNSSATTQCVTVTLTSPNGINLFTAAYHNAGFTPATPTANYLADPGVSSGSAAIYSFNVPAGQQFTVVVHEVNPNGALNSAYTLDVKLFSCAAAPACQTISLNPASIPAAQTGQAYNQVFTKSGGVEPTSFSLTGALPNGVTFNPATGALAGTPTQAGNFPFTVTVTDAVGCTISRNYTLAVNTASVTVTDPAVCTGPGGVVEISAAVRNSGGTPTTVELTASLPGGLVAVPGTCVASVGSCSVVNSSTVSYTATLAAGQTGTITYKTQIGDGIAPGTKLCLLSSVSFGGAAPVTIQSCTTVNCPLAGPGLPPDPTSPVSAQLPGSVLIYNIYTSSASSTTENTRINLTNTDPSRSVNAHLFFVDGSSCAVADMFLCLTANQTTSFLASDLDPGTTGYLVAVAVDELGCPISFNHLIGDEYVKFSSGHAANLGAEAIPAIAGGLPFCTPDSVTATLAFDGVSYAPLPRVLAVDSLGSRADGNDTMLIVNRVGGNLGIGAATLGPLFGLIYNDAEEGYSWTNTPGTCQLRVVLSNSFPRSVPRYEQIIPAGRTGWMKIAASNDNAMLGAAINFNPNAAASGSAFNQGHNLHKLTLTNTATYVIPVAAPGC